MSTPTLMVIHPPGPSREHLLDAASRTGFALQVCDSGTEGLAAFRQRPPDTVVASLDLLDMDGLGLMTSVREEAPDLSLVLVTARASVESAVAAIRLGVHDYLREPIDAAKLRALLSERYDDALRRRVRLFPAERSAGVSFHGMIGRSVPMQRLFRMLRTMAPHVRTALVSGETGTGKELVARALHQLGPRADRRFVVINCSAVVESLFESELFGHVRGAFTGATDAKPGLFELADGGTLFLDEVGELPPGVQAKLLRTIEFGEVHRVGSLEPRKVDVQVIAATNRDLQIECENGRFRRDLFYRLNVVDMHVPPLRERRDDIVYLANAFMRSTAARLAKPLSGLTSGAERLLREADWPGNVRELRNVIERACLMAEGRLVGELDIRGSLPAPRPSVHLGPLRVARPATALPMPSTAADDDLEPLSDVEREHIMRALQHAGGNKKKAASLLGVSRRALYRKLERLDLGETIARRGQGGGMMARSETEQGLDVLSHERLDVPTPVLVIDDNADVREVLATWVDADGCESLPAAGAREALEVADARGVGIALCDVQMPEYDGFWFLEQVQQRHPDMAVILVTGVHDVDWALRGLQHGVVDYLLKPFDQRSLSRALENAMRQHRLRRADRLLREQRASELGMRHARLVKAITRLHIATTEQVEAILDLVAFRSDVWREHSHRVRQLAVALATTSRVPGIQIEALGQAALLHELGRLVLPDGLLTKTGDLTAEERALWRRVPDLGASILEAVPALRPAAGIIRSRFEDYAGGGYPRQLAGDEIPVTSRVLAVADSYDAMRSPRPFRDALTHEQAVSELVRGSGTQFDPDIVRTFTRMPGLGRG